MQEIEKIESQARATIADVRAAMCYLRPEEEGTAETLEGALRIGEDCLSDPAGTIARVKAAEDTISAVPLDGTGGARLRRMTCDSIQDGTAYSAAEWVRVYTLTTRQDVTTLLRRATYHALSIVRLAVDLRGAAQAMEGYVPPRDTLSDEDFLRSLVPNRLEAARAMAAWGGPYYRSSALECLHSAGGAKAAADAAALHAEEEDPRMDGEWPWRKDAWRRGRREMGALLSA